MELVPVEEREVGGELVQTVDARELWLFLDSSRQFGNWITDRIKQYGFVENCDFVVFNAAVKNPSGGRPTKEYALTLDMAKELSMVERNARGKQARQYFIDCERRAKAPMDTAGQLLADPVFLLKASLGYAERE